MASRRRRGAVVNGDRLARLAVLFGSLSLVSFGGGNTVVPAMHHEAVTSQHWLTDRQFADLFALAQAAPGPSSLIVALIGFAAAGIAGAVVATLAMLAPSCTVMFGTCRAWDRLRASPWHTAIERGLAPVTVGLVFATALTITRAADHGPAGYALTALATLLLVRTSVSPLIVMAAAAALGLLGLV
ncbi:MAG: chromate transporter [Deltaproteobacteria bacterium]|nr:MAG: chromate transporter [Deltaproteobacteria bacterium]TMA82212.1 MAG: chromate transporter [Deltaproteobacteria bacterium]TMB15711.1 MAG: chromate transporter [Deltaproteobacteria bacterium]